MTKLDRFASLHRAGEPLLLYNVWDAGSARAVVRAGAPAVASGSFSVAGALGRADGEDLPLDDALAAARSMVEAVDVPVTIDFEGGYAVRPDQLAENAGRLAGVGAVGCNFEDRVVNGEGLHSTKRQAERVAAVVGAGLFVNARTDLFLDRLTSGADPDDAELIEPALERAAAYAEAGARCFFVPGLAKLNLIARLVDGSPLPVNVMWRRGHGGSRRTRIDRGIADQLGAGPLARGDGRARSEGPGDTWRALTPCGRKRYRRFR